VHLKFDAGEVAARCELVVAARTALKEKGEDPS